MDQAINHLDTGVDQQFSALINDSAFEPKASGNVLAEDVLTEKVTTEKATTEKVPTDTVVELAPLLSKQQCEDKAMVAAVVAGRPGAEDRLAIKFRPMIYALLIKLTSDPVRAEDLTHETLILVLQKLRGDSVNKPEKLTSFVFSIAKFSFLGWLRKKDNQVELVENMGELVSEHDSPEDECLSREYTETLETLINQLNVPRDREILKRRYLSDQSKNEICQALALTQQHYDRVISRARGRLREQMQAASHLPIAS